MDMIAILLVTRLKVKIVKE